MSVDPLVLAIEKAETRTKAPYSYVGNNPYTHVDPSGLEKEESDTETVKQKPLKGWRVLVAAGTQTAKLKKLFEGAGASVRVVKRGDIGQLITKAEKAGKPFDILVTHGHYGLRHGGTCRGTKPLPLRWYFKVGKRTYNYRIDQAHRASSLRIWTNYGCRGGSNKAHRGAARKLAPNAVRFSFVTTAPNRQLGYSSRMWKFVLGKLKTHKGNMCLTKRGMVEEAHELIRRFVKINALKPGRRNARFRNRVYLLSAPGGQKEETLRGSSGTHSRKTFCGDTWPGGKPLGKDEAGEWVNTR